MGGKIKVVKDIENKMDAYAVHLADCVVLTHDNKLLLQRRPDNWRTYPGRVNIFGGHIEEGETIVEGLKRELHEELGVSIDDNDLLFIGALTEEETDYTEAVHIYFWHDKTGSITGCYEAEPIYFANVEEALSHTKIMDYTVWAIKECQKKNLIT